MSYDNPTSFAHWQSSLASGSENSSQARAARQPQSVWGQSTSHAGTRGLTPLATSNINSSSGLGARRPVSSTSPGAQIRATSPGSANFPSLLNTTRAAGNRQASVSTSFPPLQAGAQQQGFTSSQSVTSPRSRTITPLSQVIGAASVGGLGPGGGGGGGIGGIRSGTYSPTPTGYNIISPTILSNDRSSNAPLSASSSGSGQSSFTKITVAQVLLLLDTISDKEGKTKWESKAEQLRKLIEPNGMDVWSKYFARMISRNASHIFSGAKMGDSGSYRLLQAEMGKILTDPDQAPKIAESIDASDGEFFRDFDLPKLIDHFQLDPIAACILAVAFRCCNSPDLQLKAEAYLDEHHARLPGGIQTLPKSGGAVAAPALALLIESLATSPPRNFGVNQKRDLVWAVAEHFQTLATVVPPIIASSVQLLNLPDGNRSFVQRLQRTGPKCTTSPDAAEDMLASMGLDKLNELEVANALLFMVLSSKASQYKPEYFVSAIRGKTRVKRLNWQTVVGGFDIPDLQIDSSAFLGLFKSLLPIATEDDDFELQSLWGGSWHNAETQLSFAKAYLLCTDEEIQSTQIPRFAYGFPQDIFDDAPEETKREAEALLTSHVASLPALSAVFQIALESESSSQRDDSQEVINNFIHNTEHMTLFILSAPNFPGAFSAWTETQKSFVRDCLLVFLQRQSPNYKLVLSGLFTQNPDWVFTQCYSIFTQDPMRTELILSRCEEMDWTANFLTRWGNPLAIDVACLRHREDPSFDMDKYLQELAENLPRSEKTDLGPILNKYIRIKAEDEMRTQRKEQQAPRSVPLALRTVYSLLCVLEDHFSRPESLFPTQRVCLQAYPRLINYGEDFDEILDKNHEESGNKLPEEIDKRMSDLFGKMYRGELKIREVVEQMKKFKYSQNPDDQDLFCCIIHGLFDEYSCLHEYPDDALQTTALLFGSIINFRLVSSIPLQVGLRLILEAVETPSLEQMYKFGLEALEQLRDRLPEWPSFCDLIISAPSLEGTDVYQQAREILRERGHESDRAGLDFDQDHHGVNGVADSASLANGTFDDFLNPETAVRDFRSIRADLPVKGRFSDPDASSQEKILFVINNTSNDNMTVKIKDLEEVLKHEHHQWFAEYLVEQRARLEPNNQEMYVRLLDMINDKTLHAEVLRETYVCTVKMMNADATLSSATERGHLKNLGGWLGSLTIAKDKPIKHKNIFFTQLLLDGKRSNRLAVVIPFTCKVLVQGARSTVFKPPNPWLMEIVGLLMELYDNVVDLKLNLKFEIEVLCKDIGLDHKKIDRTTMLQDQGHPFDDSLTNDSAQPDALDPFEDTPLNGINRGIRQRLSTEAVMNKMHALAEQLKYPPATSVAIHYEELKAIIYDAFQRAIREIISPVVERSITIASISTHQLIAKDYACEVDEDKYRSAARQMVKSLAGNLALVTCKEPLRMSITNYIRSPPGGALHEQLMPEGAILMCVNDNLDLACSIIADSAEENSISEIDLIIEPDLEDRRRHLAEFPGQPYIHRSIPRWAQFISDPFKQVPGGLNEVQQAVYDGFDRTLHGVGTNHTQNVSIDAGARQIPDALQDSIGMANLSTPAEQPALPHRPSQAQDEPHSATMHQPRLNGFTGNASPQERTNSLLLSIQRGARSSPARRLKDLHSSSAIVVDVRQLLLVVTQSGRPPPELLARQLAETIGSSLFNEYEPKGQLEADVMTFVLCKLCEVSDVTTRDVFRWLAFQEDPIINNAPVTLALFEYGLLESSRIDAIVSKALQQQVEAALTLLSMLLDETVFVEEPYAMRADFSGSLEAMNQWLAEEPDLLPAIEINKKLADRGMPEFVETAVSDRVRAQYDQMGYIFKEWIKMYQSPTGGDKVYASFLKDLHEKQLINSEEDSAHFIRICIDSCIDGFDLEVRRMNNASLDAAYLRIDALARLIIMLVKLQGESNGAVKIRKAPYLQSILSLVVLVQNQHQIKGDTFNQRVFFRLYSSLLYEYSMNGLQETFSHPEMMLAIAEAFLALQPAHFPAFGFAWLSLVSHRVLISGLLSLRDSGGWEAYRRLIGTMLTYTAMLSKESQFHSITEDLYRGVLRVLLLLHHDFPDFLSENHHSLCPQIPFNCTQMRNLILSALPQSVMELPDPTTPGLKVERLDEMKRSPMISGDLIGPLVLSGVKDIVDAALEHDADVVVAAGQISHLVATEQNKSQSHIFESLVLYIGSEALVTTGRFDQTSSYSVLFTKIFHTLKEEGQYDLINAIVDQIRYPNTHTNFFSKLLLHLFGLDQQNMTTRELIARVVIERLATHRPHPWGMTILFLELDHNQDYKLWELPSLAAAPQTRQLLLQTVRTR